MSVQRRKRAIPITHRKPSPAYAKQMEALAGDLLAKCEEIFTSVAGCDTAVRDTASSGLAYILHVAYDCRACALGIEGDEFATYIQACTAQWLREREFSEWFCIAGSRLFSTSDPRRLVRELMFKKA